MQSMTGYATQSLILDVDNTNRIKLSFSLKTLNSRYFDINCKLPYIFNQYETEFIKLIKSKIHRGYVYLTIYSDDQNAFKTSIQPAIATIAGYIEAANEIKTKLNLQGHISINDIIRLPNVFILEEKGVDDKSKKIIFTTINTLIEEVIHERKKEGSVIKKDISERINIMHNKINQINDLYEKSISSQKEKISKKIYDLNEISNSEINENQKQALYLTLDKMDIHEEISRFKSHLNNLNELINSPIIEKGKQIDFILQELFRESNTITAKTSESSIIDLAISIKVEIEKVREQAQNIV